ncbi:UNVERIFIED_CONTAM: hypothetical protein Sindi_0959200, partial [Sesamum indicum]
ENLEDLSDFELNLTDFRRSDQCDDTASDGAPGSERCDIDEEVVNEDEETESEGEEVESDSEAEITQVSARPSVVVALGVDGRRSGAPGHRIPRCRTVDIGTCDNVLTREQLAGLRVTYRVPSAHKIRDPPDGSFTVYTAYFDNGFFIPPHPLLVKVIRSYGICVSQLTPNSFMCFEGWRRRLLELGLPITLESFHALWIVRRVAEVSDSSDDGRYFYFTPQKACRFLAGFVSSKGPWKEKFFYVRDDGWGLASEWIACLSSLLTAAVREQKRRDQESAPPQVGSSVSTAPHGASTGSGHSGSLPTPMVGPSPPQKRQRGAILAAEGDARDAGVSQAGGSSSYWTRTRGVVHEEDLSQLADLSEEQMDELIAENMARREGDFSRLKEERDEALGHVASWERRFEREASSGKKFLASASGVAFISKTQEEAVAKFQESEEFEAILIDRAAPIYDDAVRRCRRVLRRTLHEKGRIVKDDIRFLDPDVSEGEEEVVEVADG